ncbi:hypothetical protein LVD15_12325 [Fulvivirga maritima]|uniref:hypothetical protein n=1 Tax=Fulvivirga maritima TaxID=2904247 RepID=UPI001F381C9F|nr:hypothetical protein [Fulvivirga maritima]UII29176.1 hypothetical protein LVD15_12325 [Fulvivirga maritima]
MLGSPILEVVIGIVFIYLLFSLLSTIANELIASIFRLRAKNLQSAIRRMLDDDRNKQQLSEDFYNHPLIKYLSRTDKSLPSYIEPKAFSKTLIEIILTSRKVAKVGDVAKGTSDDILYKIEQLEMEGDTIELLKTFAREAGNDWDAFSDKLENWFDQTMDRAKGWYNRKLKKITFGVGLVIAIAFNIDTIQVYQILNRNAEVRKAVLESAANYIAYAKSDSTYTVGGEMDTTTTVGQVSNKLGKFLNEQIQPNTNMLGLGWNDESLRGCGASMSGIACIIMKLGGWFITALAISLGSPFWFDLLNRLISLRGAGSNPEKEGRKEN